VCPFGFHQTSFVEKVRNGSCLFSNKFYKPWEKCGKLMEFEDLVPFPNLANSLCYSFKENIVFHKDDFLNRSFYFLSVFQVLLVFVLSSLLLLLIVFFMIIPGLKDFLKAKKIFGFGAKIRHLFSLRNQIVLISFFSNLIAALGIYSIFTDALGIFGINVIVSVYLTFIQHVQIITLWSFFLKKSKKFSLKQLTKSKM
jgi:hypothetical protein